VIAIGELTISLEQHLGKILEGSTTLMKSYRNHLLRIRDLLTSSRDLKVEEGDYCVRFNVINDTHGLNKIFFLYEVRDIGARVLWRSLLRSSIGLSSFLLRKRVTFLPSYSFSFDRTVTFVYWGERQPLLDPNKLKKMELESCVVSLDKPSQAVCSSANLVWPKAVSRAYKDPRTVNLARDYLFNALFPPKITDITNVWSEAPYVIVGDDALELFTIHKTICSLNYFYICRGEDFAKAFVDILDSDLSVKRVKCYIPRDSLEEIKSRPVTEAIISKRFKVYKPRSAQRSFYLISLYPFESTEIFRENVPGVLVTVASIILRSLYFRSSQLTMLEAGLPEIRNLILWTFKRRPFDKYPWETLGSRLLGTLEGTRMLLELLGVYTVQATKVMFIHPSLVECAYSLLGGYNLHHEEIKAVSTLLAEMIDHLQTSYELKSIFDLQEVFKEKLGLRLGFQDAKKLLGLLRIIKNTIIPLSKQLNNPHL
jgi:hypothetical protein